MPLPIEGDDRIVVQEAATGDRGIGAKPLNIEDVKALAARAPA